jgi:hypothetical protein
MPFDSIEREITDEEFYRVCSQDLREIDSYDISDEEKLKLKYCIYDVVIRYGEGKENRTQLEESGKRLGESLGNLVKSVYAIGETVSGISTGLENITRVQQGTIQQLKENGKVLARIKQYADESIRNLEDAQDNMDKTNEGMGIIKKGIKEVKRRFVSLKQEYERRLEAKQTVIDLSNGMRRNPEHKN